MNRNLVVCLPGLLFLTSCFLSKEFRTADFRFAANGSTVAIPLVVPKGFVRQERVDTAGIALQSFYYPGGAVFYVAHLQDTSYLLQAINERMHQPKFNSIGATVFKGIDENELFYREIRRDRLRVGYRQVPEMRELAFDSATNYAASRILSTLPASGTGK